MHTMSQIGPGISNCSYLIKVRMQYILQVKGINLKLKVCMLRNQSINQSIGSFARKSEFITQLQNVYRTNSKCESIEDI